MARGCPPRDRPDFAPSGPAEAGDIELLLVGTGLDIAAIDPALRGWLKDAGVGLDVMQTGAAARTYNILVAENRKVAAALIAVA